MKKSMLFFATLLLGIEVAYGCILTMPASGGRPPFFEQQNSTNTWQGLGVVLLVQISQQLDCKPKVIDLPWGRALHMLQKGQLDLMTNLTKTKERERYLDFVGPHSYEKLVLLLSKTEEQIKQLEDISQLKGQIAVLAHGYYGDEFQRLFQHNPEFRRRIVPVSSSNAMKMMLATGRVSGLIEDKQVIQQWHQQQQLLSADFYAPLTVNATPVYIGLSKKALNQQQRDRIRNWWDNSETARLAAE